jgi:hypothetical protein
MKLSQLLFALIFLIPNLGLGQEKIEFDLVFGSYMNNHYQKEFHTAERQWMLKSDELIYSIDAHGTRYADTLSLNQQDLNLIRKRLEENKLHQSIIKDLSVDYLEKQEWIVSIKGSISIQDKIIQIDIKANGPSILENDLDAEKLNQFEALLYRIIENY